MTAAYINLLYCNVEVEMLLLGKFSHINVVH